MAFKIRNYNTNTVLEPKVAFNLDFTGFTFSGLNLVGGTVAPAQLDTTNMPVADPGSRKAWANATDDVVSVTL